MTSLTLLGGLILGLVSSLHCVAMCGGLGGTLSISLGRSTAFPDRARALAMAQVGKMVAYVAAGAVVGGFGSTLYGLFDQHAAYAVLQRFGALVLVWTAISLTGLLPSPTRKRHGLRKSTLQARLASTVRFDFRLHARGVAPPFPPSLAHPHPGLA